MLRDSVASAAAGALAGGLNILADAAAGVDTSQLKAAAVTFFSALLVLGAQELRLYMARRRSRRRSRLATRVASRKENNERIRRPRRSRLSQPK